MGFYMVNDFYAKDGGRRVRTGMRQKQKDGLVMIPPFGYFKDKNTGEVIIIEETAAIVRQVFQLYVSGHGFKAIARILNEQGIYRCEEVTLGAGYDFTYEQERIIKGVQKQIGKLIPAVAEQLKLAQGQEPQTAFELTM